MLCPNCRNENPSQAQFCMSCGSRLSTEELAHETYDTDVSFVQSGSDFVGRQRELGELAKAFEDALSGNGNIVALVGEPGIGKTRTAQQLAELAEERGAYVLWGRCYEEGGAPSYWPWIQSLRPYIDSKDADQLEAEMGELASSVAEVIPEIRQKLTDIRPLPQLEPEQARFRLFDSIATFFRKASEAQPLVVVLDDLHWADKSSLMLLEFIAREIGNSHLLLVCTYRDVELNRQHPLADTLGNLTRESSFQRVLLRGLSKESVASFVKVVSGITPSPALVDLLHTQTEGNPLFISETVRLLTQEGSLTESTTSLDVRIPEGVREVIGRRLNRLSIECNDVLTVASVLGREFQLHQLDRVLDDISQDALLDILEDGLKARVIEELPNVIASYQFTHALVQETLLSELSLTRRVRLHAQIALTLEDLYGDDAETHAAELAHHFAQAETLLGTEKIVQYSSMAGERAIASYAYEDAISHFEQGVVAKRGGKQDSELALLLFGLGKAVSGVTSQHDSQRVVDLFMEAFAIFEEFGDVKNAVAVASYPNTAIGQATGTGIMAGKALGMVDPKSDDAGFLQIHYGMPKFYEENDYLTAKRALEESLDIAKTNRNQSLESRSLAYLTSLESTSGHRESTIEYGLKAIELADSIGDMLSGIRARWYTSGSLARLGELTRAETIATKLLEDTERLRNRTWITRSAMVNSMIACARGDWKTLKRFVDTGLSIHPNDPNHVIYSALLHFYIAGAQDSNEVIEELFEKIRGRSVPRGPGAPHGYTTMIVPHFLRVGADERWLALAENAAQTVLDYPYSLDMTVFRARYGLGLISVLMNDQKAAIDNYRHLVSMGQHTEFGLTAYRILGMLSHTMGNFDTSQSHFEDALAFCRKADYRPELAWSQHDYAEMLFERNKAGDVDKASALLDESLAISIELGMKPLMERVLTLKEKVGAKSSKSPAYPDGLTQREAEVIGLIAQGKTNQEIADELFISLRTVANHVTNILSKTDSANRAEAAIYAERNRLTTQEP